MHTLRLTPAEVASIDALVDEIAGRYDTVESDEFQQESRTYAEELPRRVRAEINDFRLGESAGVFVLSGLPVDDSDIGPTPAHWKAKRIPSPTLRQDIAFFLIASLLGDAIGWATQQAGYVMHDILPIKGHEFKQQGSGSEVVLTWHTEDAFHPLRTDYLGLMCLRNPDGVQTTFADISDVEIDDATRKILSEPRFSILPDYSHRAHSREVSRLDDPDLAELLERSYQEIERMTTSPDPIAVLFGDPKKPYVRIDPYFMTQVEGEVEREALDVIIAAMDAALAEIALQPGDLCFLDNYRVVHGRQAFRARFDGTDRWLRRLNITRDLRKSRGFRLTARSRVIY